MKVKKCLRWLLSHLKICLWVLAVLISLGIFLALQHGDENTMAELSSQLAAQRWETEEKPYAQATVFLRDEDGIPQDAISGIRLAVENALTAAGVASDTHPWLYAFSRTEQAELINGIASSKVEVTLISGDYFTIHPMNVRSGWYLDDTEVMRDRIILDRKTAWDLFYSDNVVGQFLEWNGQRYMVAAVVDTESGKYNDMAAEGTQRAWAFSDSPSADPAKGFTCVEMVLPQPVKNFTVSTMQNALTGYIPEDTTVVDITERFSLVNRWNALREISTRWISSKAISYPYYENAARLTENHLALRLIPEGFFLSIPLVSVLIWLILLNRKRTWGLHSISDAIDRAVQRKRTRDYEARLRGEIPEKKRKKRERSLRKPKHKARGGVDFSSLKYGTTKRRR